MTCGSAPDLGKLAATDAVRIASIGAVRSLGIAIAPGTELVSAVTNPTTNAVNRLMPMPTGSQGASGPRKISAASETEKMIVRNHATSAVGSAGRKAPGDHSRRRRVLKDSRRGVNIPVKIDDDDSNALKFFMGGEKRRPMCQTPPLSSGDHPGKQATLFW